MISFYIMTLFPELCDTVLSESIIGRARKSDVINVECFNIRDFSNDKHKRVDDYPFGGGEGMVMQAQPVYDCYMSIKDRVKKRPSHCIYMSPQGRTLTQEKVVELSTLEDIIILCGHYEGVDQRVIDMIVDEEISIGDYVVTGGEMPACILVDSVSRMVGGVLSSEKAVSEESHYNGVLEYPQYTRPSEVLGQTVPDILLSGDHAKIEKWRRLKALEVTFIKRPEMLDNIVLTEEEKKFIYNLNKE